MQEPNCSFSGSDSFCDFFPTATKSRKRTRDDNDGNAVTEQAPDQVCSPHAVPDSSAEALGSPAAAPDNTAAGPVGPHAVPDSLAEAPGSPAAAPDNTAAATDSPAARAGSFNPTAVSGVADDSLTDDDDELVITFEKSSKEAYEEQVYKNLNNLYAVDLSSDFPFPVLYEETGPERARICSLSSDFPAEIPALTPLQKRLYGCVITASYHFHHYGEVTYYGFVCGFLDDAKAVSVMLDGDVLIFDPMHLTPARHGYRTVDRQETVRLRECFQVQKFKIPESQKDMDVIFDTWVEWPTLAQMTSCDGQLKFFTG